MKCEQKVPRNAEARAPIIHAPEKPLPEREGLGEDGDSLSKTNVVNNAVRLPQHPTHAPMHSTSPTTRPALIISIAWLLALAAVIAARFRADWPPYKALHQWAAVQGLPDWARNLDSLILFAGAAFAGAIIIARPTRTSVTAVLRLRRGRPGWPLMALFALTPMLLGGLILGLKRAPADNTTQAFLSSFIASTLRAPLAEELLFRGLLIAALAPAFGWRGPRFWINASAAALLFAVIHIAWTSAGFADGWPILLVTAAGGLWYAWLLSRWQTLWLPIALHAGMNLAWLLASATGGAGSGIIENALRAATITIATWWTIRATPRP